MQHNPRVFRTGCGIRLLEDRDVVVFGLERDDETPGGGGVGWGEVVGGGKIEMVNCKNYKPQLTTHNPHPTPHNP